MGRKAEKEVVKWISLEELNKEIRKMKSAKMLRKLFFIKELYKGVTVTQATKKLE